ncbi:hypothetical protein [Limibacterium fermenti]|uniref:hypothetical protein n=1 Tax=Limibacterium fermenti TaxID=3229863 RepID=UPI000E992BD2|nr:MFS transporter [Porphyromonadaceae bacterium]
MTEYNKGLLYKWVPGLGMLGFIILIESMVMLINPIYAGNIGQMASSTGILAEYYMWGNYAVIIGLSLVLPFILRIKFRFRSKELLITALVVMATMTMIVATTHIGEIVVVACLIFGIAKMIGMVEMLLPIQAILSPDGDKKRFYAIFYPISIGSGQLGTFLPAVLSLDTGWQYLHYYGAATLLLLAMICVIVMHNQRFAKKLPFIHIDWLGLLLFGTILMSLAYIYAFGKQQDWFNSANILVAAIIVLVSIFTLIIRQLTIKHPFLSFKLYKIRDVRFGILLLVGQGLFMGASSILSIYTSAILGYNWLTNAELGLMTLPGIVLAGFVAFHWTKNQIPIKMYIFSGFAAYFLYMVMLYFMMVPELNITQLYFPQILNGYGMCSLFISIWIYTFDKVPQSTILPSVAPVMIFRSFVMLGLFTSLIGWLQYEFQWQSIGDMAVYFDSLALGYNLGTGGSMRDVQLGAILAANKRLLGYVIVAGLGILLFVLFHQFGRQKYAIARYRAYLKK